MTEKQKFSDDELTAWLDGEFDHTRAREIELALETDSELAERVERLSVDLDGMRGAFDALLANAPAAPQMPELAAQAAVPEANDNRLFSPMRCAIAGLALCIAGVVGYGVADKQDTSWRGYVAAYQALYISETLVGIDRPAAELEVELARVSDVISKPIQVAALEATDILTYKRAQLLGFEGRPLAQLAFLTASGDPVALCIIRSEDAAAMATEFGEMEGLSSASWSADGFEYLLIGTNDDALIRDAAKQFSATI